MREVRGQLCKVRGAAATVMLSGLKPAASAAEILQLAVEKHYACDSRLQRTTYILLYHDQKPVECLPGGHCNHSLWKATMSLWGNRTQNWSCTSAPVKTMIMVCCCFLSLFFALSSDCLLSKNSQDMIFFVFFIFSQLMRPNPLSDPHQNWIKTGLTLDGPKIIVFANACSAILQKLRETSMTVSHEKSQLVMVLGWHVNQVNMLTWLTCDQQC